MSDDLTKRRAEIRKLNAQRRRLQGKEPEPAHSTRLTVSEVARTLLSRTPREMSHVSLTRSTVSPNVGIEVVVYVGESDDLATIEAAKDRCQTLYDELAALYPRVEKEAKANAS